MLAPGAFDHEILATLPEGVALLRPDGRVRSANAPMALMLGLPQAAVPGLRLEERLSAPIPALPEGEMECELRRDGRSPLAVAVVARTLCDRQGLEIGTLVVVRDLSELVSLRERVLLSGRLAAVGELAAGIAHEINNPLAFVRANLSLLRQHWASVEEALAKEKAAGAETSALLGEGEELLEESLEGVDRATRIVRDVRGLAHGGGRQPETAILERLLDGVLRIAGPQLRGRIAVSTDMPDDSPVRCAPQELQQVFLNLVLNAAQAIEDRGSIRVRVRRENGFVVTSIEDDGCGIDPAIRDRIFDPFFTTKGVGEGTGLGLGIAYGIVRQHGGDIVVESEPGRGTCFCVHLPVATDTLPVS
jgi:two-component system NtrC family sensor kinase